MAKQRFTIKELPMLVTLLLSKGFHHQTDLRTINMTNISCKRKQEPGSIRNQSGTQTLDQPYLINFLSLLAAKPSNELPPQSKTPARWVVSANLLSTNYCPTYAI